MRPLVWFRRDLRVQDNTALYEACHAADDGVVGVFVVSRAEWKAHDDAPAKIDFWLRNLGVLSKELESLRIPLRIVTAEKPSRIAPRLLALAEECACDALYFNHEYEVNEQRRDETVSRLFEKRGRSVRTFHDHVVIPPAEIHTGQGGFYSIYSPFKRAWLRRIEEEGYEVRPKPAKQKSIGVKPDAVPDRVPEFESPIDPALWPAGEAVAHDRLASFCRDRIRAYKEDRDIPSLDATSRLSPYLSAGVVSPRQCIGGAAAANNNRLDDSTVSGTGPAQWISEVIWREFYQHVIVGYPRVCMHRAFRPATDRIEWSQDQDLFRRWCEGRTGVPIVDAGMRQLRATGWMHNRLRMVVAMYLTKDLFIDWRWGEKFFMRHLVDGDLGSNNGGWQWSASTGTDAAPYFRVFNPVSQSKRCDPGGEFIRRWVPELRGVEGAAVHDPASLPGLLRGGLDYPEPLVDHAEARERVLAAFKALDDRAPTG